MPLKPITAMRKDRASAKGVKLQHRHFAFIAGVIKSQRDSKTETPAAIRRWASYFANDLPKTNHNFDRARFFTALGLADPIVEQPAYPSETEGEYIKRRK